MNGRTPVGSGRSRSGNQSMPSAASDGSNHSVGVTRATSSPVSAVVVVASPLKTDIPMPIRPSRAPHFCLMVSAIAKNMGICATVQLIWPLRVTFHLSSNAEVTSFTSFLTASNACLTVRKPPGCTISSRFWKASACRSGCRPMYRAMRARAYVPAVVTSSPRAMNALRGSAAYHGTAVWMSEIISCGR